MVAEKVEDPSQKLNEIFPRVHLCMIHPSPYDIC